MNKAPEKNMEVRPDKNTGEKKNESGWRGLLHVAARFFPVSYTHLTLPTT